MRSPFKIGLSFGLTSGVITSLGLMIGLYSGTHSRLAVIGGLLTIAIADSCSDALGIHISQESQKEKSQQEIWQATISTFLSKFFFSMTFAIPVFLLDLLPAMVVSVSWGLGLLAVFSFLIGRRREEDPWKLVLEHLLIALLVIVATYFTGEWIAQLF